MKLSPLYKWIYGTADKDSFVSTKKIEENLGWKARYSNQDALITSHKWYLEHKDEVQSLDSGVTHRVGWNQVRNARALIEERMRPSTRSHVFSVVLRSNDRPPRRPS